MPQTIADGLQGIINAKSDIDGAIEVKGGIVTKGLVNTDDDIMTIPNGGGGSSGTDVIFYDYDGSVVDSYSAADFANLSELPANPTHEGLTAQGWNWSLSDAKTYVAAYGKLNIGQQYVTDDGKTRIYINLPEGRISPVLMLYLNTNTELDIDWGDGSTHSTWTTTSADYKSERHSYPDKGEYVIAITVVSGSFNLQSQNTSYNTFFTDGKNNTNSSDRSYLNSIQKIEIGAGISQIGSSAFKYCHSLSSITIPDSITSISDSAFYYCYALSSITIGNSVTTIGSSVFVNCYSLSSITIPNSVTTIGIDAFHSCISLSSISISDSVTSIQIAAFQYCYLLSSITIPNSVTTIQNNAFFSCYALSSITIPNSVTTIGSSAFQNCYALSSITIGNSVTTIGSYAFYYCYALSSITIPKSVTTIGTYAFQNCYALSSVTIPDTVTSIGSSAFGDCYSLSSITIPDSVTTIGSIFYSCYSLSSITIPNSVTTIGSSAFSSCHSLSSITIGNSVTTIGSGAFSDCYSLSSITIPNSVTTIQNNAFGGCNGMDYIRFIGTTPPTVQNSSAWTNVSTSTILYVPAESLSTYKSATNYPNPSTYKYVGYATYASGDPLPSSVSSYNLIWYATIEDWIADTNPITVGNGNEVYAKLGNTLYVSRTVDFVNNTTSIVGNVNDFNVYSNMKRCNVADDGTINAYDGDAGYIEDGTNGQVMVYVPKFYYKLDVSQTGDLDGVNIRKGTWSIADTKLDNTFKLHPAFLAADGVTELDYFLYSAFDGIVKDSVLSSIGGGTTKPSSSHTRATYRTYATNRGTGWNNIGIKQTMAIQMLFAVEYGFNSQTTLGRGVVSASSPAHTGLTTGSISSGDLTNNTTPVNYRGVENLWGDIWKMVDGINFNDRTPYVCDTYTFVDSTSTGYTAIAFNLPSTSDTYTTAFGYDANNDWILLPSESSSTAATSGPIGDKVWSNSGWTIALLGGSWVHGTDAGLFAWSGYDGSSASSSYFGGRLMYIPQQSA